METRLKQIIEEKGITTYKVAKDLGISPSFFYRYSVGGKMPKYDRMLKIANYLQVEVKDIWT